MNPRDFSKSQGRRICLSKFLTTKELLVGHLKCWLFKDQGMLPPQMPKKHEGFGIIF